MHAGNSIIFIDLGKHDAQHIVDISSSLESPNQREISEYIAELLDHSAHRSSVKCIFEDNQVNELLDILKRYSANNDLIAQVQGHVQ